jgi:hypothetical protein
LREVGLSLKGERAAAGERGLAGERAAASTVSLDGKAITHTLRQTGSDIMITLREKITIEKGQSLHIQIG